LDGKPAHFIFLVLSPRDTSSPHIKILAQITRNFREGNIGDNILKAGDTKQIFEIIKNFK
jgi:mannitol/fructose-specific phosphotransferase system IIA component (Ntr-type)